MRNIPGRESMIYGLMLPATELGLEVSDDAGRDGFDPGYLAQEILTDLLGRMHRLGLM